MLKRSIILSFMFCILFLSACSKPRVIKRLIKNPTKVKVIKVIDGDTLHVAHYGAIRIVGIDAPELNEKSYKFKEDLKMFKTKAADEKRHANYVKNYLITLLQGKNVKIKRNKHKLNEELGYKRNGRILGFVKFEGEDLAKKLLSEGLVRCWEDTIYDAYFHNRIEDYKLTQEFAKKEGIGLWRKN